MDSLWQHCFADFLLHLRDRSGSEHTVRSYRAVLTRFLAMYDPELATRADVEAFIRAPLVGTRRNGQVPSPATRNRSLAVLSSFYRYSSTYAVHHSKSVPLFSGILPTAGIPQSKVGPSGQTFSEAELGAFFGAIRAAIAADPGNIAAHRDYAIFWLLVTSSRRKSEIINLHWHDVEATTFTDRQGRSRSGYRFRFFSKGKSQVPDYTEMSSSAYQAITRYLEVSGRLHDMQPDDAIFLPVLPQQGGGHRIIRTRPLSGNAVLYRLKFWCRKAGLDPAKFWVHLLRHASARERYIASSFDVRAVQRALRHSSLDYTARYLEELVGDDDPTLPLLEKRFRYLTE